MRRLRHTLTVLVDRKPLLLCFRVPHSGHFCHGYRTQVLLGEGDAECFVAASCSTPHCDSGRQFAWLMRCRGRAGSQRLGASEVGPRLGCWPYRGGVTRVRAARLAAFEESRRWTRMHSHTGRPAAPARSCDRRLVSRVRSLPRSSTSDGAESLWDPSMTHRCHELGQTLLRRRRTWDDP